MSPEKGCMEVLSDLRYDAGLQPGAVEPAGGRLVEHGNAIWVFTNNTCRHLSGHRPFQRSADDFRLSCPAGEQNAFATLQELLQAERDALAQGCRLLEIFLSDRLR